MSTYFADREYGTRPPTIDVIDGRLWAGLYSLIQTRIGDGSFGLRFPEQCTDGHGPCGCDEQSFRRVLAAEVPWVEWPLSPSEVPATPVILDLLKFCAGAVGQPVQESFHEFFRHHHLSWDRAAGLERFVADVNMLFRRNALAFELTPEGQARRLLPAQLTEAIGWTLFQTGDGETDRLLEAARRRFVSPKMEDRQDSLEKLWDAFERLKTLEPGANKRVQADALLDRVAAPNSAFRQLLAREAVELTNIGNSFRIRHSEITQEALTSPDQIDYLFMRMFAFVRMVLKGTGRGG
ncbi:hypothetical protein SAE02_53230 [Skermanella aerolata]|uniref:Uncharacterized protein n=1 Tax=Skermanella aerolata TaxID=393310 RepID=A0A512DXH7_9PROT|nr:hypothetical protein [Skermanella aerolata]KJB92202.1 hypothetical protein N826_15950 [Skermanella aerolata KACC 11604]GEO41175.1 hypothetical protein SAE02_53230 [Skermanella aerolata]